jgi:hypothetical protein
MRMKWKSSVLVLGMMLVLSTSAFAHRKDPAPPGGVNGAAPEVDPSLAIAGLTFLSGSLVVLRSRLRK